MAAERVDGPDEEFSAADRDAIMETLDALKGVESLLVDPQFLSSLGSIVSAFTAAGLSMELIEIDDSFRPSLEKSGVVAAELASYWGRELVGSPGAPERDGESWTRFYHYASVARARNYPEVDLLWKLLFDFRMSGGRSDLGWELIRDAQGLGEADRSGFFSALLQLSECTLFQSRCTPSGARVARSAAGVVEAYHGGLREGLARACRRLISAPVRPTTCDTLLARSLTGLTTSESRQVELGEPVTGVLSKSDDLLPNGTYAQAWIFNTENSGTVFVDLVSTAFDAFLAAAVDGEVVATDDDAGGACSARLQVAVRAGEPLVLVVNTVEERSSGGFTLRVGELPSPAVGGSCRRGD